MLFGLLWSSLPTLGSTQCVFVKESSKCQNLPIIDCKDLDICFEPLNLRLRQLFKAQHISTENMNNFEEISLSEYLHSNIAFQSLPLSIPIKIETQHNGFTVSLPIWASHDLCHSSKISIFSQQEAHFFPSQKIEYCGIIDAQCFCDVYIPPGTQDIIAYSQAPLPMEMLNDLTDISDKRFLILENMEQNMEQITPAISSLSNSTNLGPPKFDIGIVTHFILVVLAITAFIGNSMFVVFVFWLSK